MKKTAWHYPILIQKLSKICLDKETIDNPGFPGLHKHGNVG